MVPVVCSLSEKYRLSLKEPVVLHHLLFYRNKHIGNGRMMEGFGSSERSSWEPPKGFAETNVEFLLLWEQLKIAGYISHSRILF